VKLITWSELIRKCWSRPVESKLKLNHTVFDGIYNLFLYFYSSQEFYNCAIYCAKLNITIIEACNYVLEDLFAA